MCVTGFAWSSIGCGDSIAPGLIRDHEDKWRERWTTYLSTGGSDGSTDLDLSRRFPEFLGVFASSSAPF